MCPLIPGSSEPRTVFCLTTKVQGGNMNLFKKSILGFLVWVLQFHLRIDFGSVSEICGDGVKIIVLTL